MTQDEHKVKFADTVAILVKAYLNNELKHGDCECCAVGNIVHAAGYKKYYHEKMQLDSCGIWKNVFCTDDGVQQWRTYRDEYYFAGIQCIESTGYSTEELARVEYAFEKASDSESNDERMFNGLMAVVDVLAEIHGIDLKQAEEAKQLFVKA
jgi:hypothetical protein